MLLADKKHVAITTLPHQVWSDLGEPLPVIINKMKMMLIPIVYVPETRDNKHQYFFGVDYRGVFYDVEIHRPKDVITTFREIWNTGLVFKTNVDKRESTLRCKLLLASYLKRSSDVKEIFDHALTLTYTPFDKLYTVSELANKAAEITEQNCAFNKSFVIKD